MTTHRKSFKELGFKIGDKVRCVRDYWETPYPPYSQGNEYEVVRHPYGYEDAVIMCNGFTWNGTNGDWEMVTDTKFKIGDRVKIRKDSEWYVDYDKGNPKGMAGIVYDTERYFLPVAVEWDNGTKNSYDHHDLEYWVEPTKEKEDDMNTFVEETEVVTKKKAIKKVVDGYGPGWSRVSIVPENGYTKAGPGVDSIKLVIGAHFEDRYCENFGKKTLRELIDQLEEVWELME